VLAVSSAAVSQPTRSELESQVALTKHYGDSRGQPVVVVGKGKTYSIELCLDLCEYYESKSLLSRREVWDLVFLNEFYYGDRELLDDFRERTSSLAGALLVQYRSLCGKSTAPADLPLCIVKKLAARNHLRHGYVRYDEGWRCLIWLKFGDSEYQSEDICTEMRAR
jgi:hypothetical protein